jgi:hypothetical protein
MGPVAGIFLGFAARWRLQATKKSRATHGVADRDIYATGPLSSDEDPGRGPHKRKCRPSIECMTYRNEG